MNETKTTNEVDLLTELERDYIECLKLLDSLADLNAKQNKLIREFFEDIREREYKK